MTNEEKRRFIELSLQYEALNNNILQTNYTVEDCITLGFERVKSECHNHEQCTSKCKYYDKHGCHFRLSPEYWEIEKIKKGVIS